jgi:hypothetical protein
VRILPLLLLLPCTLVACAKASPSGPPPADCGAFDLGLADHLPATAARCLIDAAKAGRPARLKVTRSTDEGDPIPVTYTARADGSVEVLTDTRQDAFGDQKITSETCTGPSAADYGIDFAACTGRED